MDGSPATQSTLLRLRHNDRDKVTVLIVGGMQDHSAAQCVEQALRTLAGIDAVGVNLLTRMVTVRHAHQVAPHAILEALSATGFEGTLANTTTDSDSQQLRSQTADEREEIAVKRSRFFVGAMLTFLLFLVDRFLQSEGTTKALWLFLLATPVQLSIGWPFYRGFIQALQQRTFTMDSLIVIGASAAYLQGVLAFLGRVTDDPDLQKWPPMFLASAGILTIVSLGAWLEAMARALTSARWGNLLDLMPLEARVLRDERLQRLPTGVVGVGDIVVVKTNEQIPVDGTIVEGESQISETMLTGEDHPKVKGVGDRVYVASVNLGGDLSIKATAIGMQSSLGQIARAVADARQQKGYSEQLVDRLAAALVPLAIGLAGMTFLIWYFGPALLHLYLDSELTILQNWVDGLRETSFAFIAQGDPLAFLRHPNSISDALRPAIAVLMVACPCALALATPMVVLIATGIAARGGLLIKGSQALEAAGRVTDVIFDKTGVLTEGLSSAQELVLVEGVSRTDFLNIAASLEMSSGNALARGLVHEARKGALTLNHVSDFRFIPGQGIGGVVEGRRYLLGSAKLLEANNISLTEALQQRIEGYEAQGASMVYLVDAQLGVLGAIALTDRLKPGAAVAVRELASMRLTIHLLSSDRALSAKAIGRQCGIVEHICAEMSSEDKMLYCWDLRDRGHQVAMVGDGLHDAPCMAAANVGIAMGTGKDATVDSGAIVVTSGDPRGIARAIALCRESVRLIRWNLCGVIALNACMIPLAMLDRLNIGIAAAVMVSSSMLVVLNALRLSDSRIDKAQALPAPLAESATTV